MPEITINETSAERQKRIRQHYMLSSGGTVAGLALLMFAGLGVMGVAGFSGIIPWTFLVSLFLIIPGIAGLLRGPGELSTYVIPRPKQRTRMNGPAKTAKPA